MDPPYWPAVPGTLQSEHPATQDDYLAITGQAGVPFPHTRGPSMPGPFVPASASAGPAAVRPYPRLSTSDTTNISYHQLPQQQYHHHPALDVSSHGSVSAFLPQAYHPSQHVSPQPAFPPPRPPPIHQSSTATNRTYSSLPPQHVQQPPPYQQNPFQQQQQQRYPPPTAPPPAHPQAPMPYQMPTQAQIRAESDELQLQIEEEYRRVKQAEWEMVRLQTAAAGNQSRGSSAGFGHSVHPGSGSMYPSVPSGMTGSAPSSNAQTNSMPYFQPTQQTDPSPPWSTVLSDNQPTWLPSPDMNDLFAVQSSTSSASPSSETYISGPSSARSQTLAPLSSFRSSGLTVPAPVSGTSPPMLALSLAPPVQPQPAGPIAFAPPSSSAFKKPPSSKPAPSKLTKSATAPKSASDKKKRILHPGTHLATCKECHETIAHLQLRGEPGAFEVEWEGVWECKACLERKGDGSLGEAETMVKKKRNREMQDTQGPLECDVCFKIKGSGGIFPIDGKSPIEFAVEFVCDSCNDTYRRCSDCGGGGGGRIGIGKWRCKELFLPGRKTCFLSHARLSSAPLDLAVWKLDELGQSPVRADFLRLMEELWREKTYNRLAIPEILESEKGGTSRSFADIKHDLDLGWPIKEKLFMSTGSRSTDIVQPYIGLTWCKSKSRKQSSVDSEDVPAVETFLKAKSAPKMNKINNLGYIPDGYDLAGLLFGYWRKEAGSLMVTTWVPFETTNSDDRTFLIVGEFLCQILPQIESINQQRLQENQRSLSPAPPRLLPSLEHLWTTTDTTDPVISERMKDMLSRRRQFHTLDQYFLLHPGVDPSMFVPDPAYLPSDRQGWLSKQDKSNEVLARWLGSNLDMKKVEEIFTAEFERSQKPRRKKSLPAPEA